MSILSILLAISTVPWINALLWIVVIAVIFSVVWWALGALAIPEPFNRVIRAVLIIIAVIIVIKFLIAFLGNPF